MTHARFVGTAIAALAITMGVGECCMATEQAHYSVVGSYPPYEIRDYAGSVVAVVAVDGSRSTAVSAGFRLLANYIFGNNQQKTKIAMTVPVTQMPLSSPRGMSSRNESAPAAWVVRFMMPAQYTLQSLPTPTDARVQFEQTNPHRVASIRFSGFWSDYNLTSHQNELERWMNSRHLVPRSAPVYAYYDPPWTPWFMRTIEVLIEVG